MASIHTLSRVSITYHDSTTSITSSSKATQNIAAAASGVGKFVSGLFSNTRNSNGNGTNGNGTNAAGQHHGRDDINTSTGTYRGPTASLNIVDTLRGPALAIQHHKIYNDDDDDDDYDDDDVNGNGNGNRNDASKKIKAAAAAKDKTIPLKRIGEISANDSFLSSSSTISIYSKKKHSKDQHKELCRIDLHTRIHTSTHTETIDHEHDREEIIQALKMLIQWDAQRRASQPEGGEEEEDDDEEDEEGRGGLGQRALKMKHFAQREIELKRVKKDREDRKARYLKDSGGLKYTAVAMANRAEMS